MSFELVIEHYASTATWSGARYNSGTYTARPERYVGGVCSGTRNGFCTLTLTQTADGFDGTIMLSSPPGEPSTSPAI